MKEVLLCAAVVGLATVAGSLLSFWGKTISQKANDILLSFAAGVMLGATFFSLLMPALGETGDGVWFCLAGLAAGVVLVRALNRFVPQMHSILKTENKQSPELDRVMLFLIAIAIHNLPEGMAVGVSFGSGETSNAVSIAIGIALQNIPEGMITILPLLLAGVSRKRAFVVALLTGLTEVIGTLIGYAAVTVAAAVMPFLLALAGGAMLYVICHDMIPDTHGNGHADAAMYSLIGGLMVMLLIQRFV